MEPIVAVSATLWGLSIVVSLAFAFLCGWIAFRKGRSFLAWGILGFIFSLITLIVVLLVPRRRR